MVKVGNRVVVHAAFSCRGGAPLALEDQSEDGAHDKDSDPGTHVLFLSVGRVPVYREARYLSMVERSLPLSEGNASSTMSLRPRPTP